MAHLRPALRILLFLLSAAAITSCSKSSPTEIGPDSVTVVSIQPTGGTTLQAGSLVSFSATIDYHLSSAQSGSISVVVEDQDFKHFSSTVVSSPVTVARGIGTVTHSGSVVLPATGVSTLYVLFPLMATGDSRTQTVAAVSYRVSPAAAPGLAPAVPPPAS
jgi:hypothetical protein